MPEIYSESHHFPSPGLNRVTLTVAAHEVEVDNDHRYWYLLHCRLSDGDYLDILEKRGILKAHNRAGAIRLAIEAFDRLKNHAPRLIDEHAREWEAM